MDQLPHTRAHIQSRKLPRMLQGLRVRLPMIVAATAAVIAIAAASLGSGKAWSFNAQNLPGALSAGLPSLRLAGTGKLTWWGFDVYEARLWVDSGFKSDRFAQSFFSLEVKYLRDFSGEDIAQRSLVEMQRVASPRPEQAAQWREALLKALPDVKKGDRLTGLHRPGQGLVLVLNDRLHSEVTDPELARAFFAIWLAPKTSAPQLREALLAQADN